VFQSHFLPDHPGLNQSSSGPAGVVVADFVYGCTHTVELGSHRGITHVSCVHTYAHMHTMTTAWEVEAEVKTYHQFSWVEEN
jgi:hypothetical protein